MGCIERCVAAMLRVAALIAALAPAAFPARAAEPCRLPAIATARVASVSDGRTFRLEDGREVRLAAIEVPPRSESDDGPAAAARATLEGLIGGRIVTLRRLGPAEDRYGRLVAAASREDSDRTAQEEMLERGFARVSARIDDKACAGALLGAERTARNAGLGLWAGPHYLKYADKPADLLAESGKFAVIEGKVLSVRRSGGTIYVNFGRRFVRDFAVTISKRDERLLVASGIEPERLEGRDILVRGWIEERGGPRIAVARPEQIEFVTRR